MSWDSGERVTEEELRLAVRCWANEYLSAFHRGPNAYKAAISRAKERAETHGDDKMSLYFNELADLLEVARRIDLESLEGEE